MDHGAHEGGMDEQHKKMRAAAAKKKYDEAVKDKPPGEGSRFAALSAAIAAKGKVKDARAVAAQIGRKKYGAKKMAKMAAMGRKKG